MLRPVVPVAVAGTEVTSPMWALVDSGCSHVIAAPWVATAAGVDPRDSVRRITLGLGGDTGEVRFLDRRLRLCSPGHAQALAIEDGETFDGRFPAPLAP